MRFRKLTLQLLFHSLRLPLADPGRAQKVPSYVAGLKRLVVDEQERASFMPGAALDEEFREVAADGSTPNQRNPPTGQRRLLVHVPNEYRGQVDTRTAVPFYFNLAGIGLVQFAGILPAAALP